MELAPDQLLPLDEDAENCSIKIRHFIRHEDIPNIVPYLDYDFHGLYDADGDPMDNLIQFTKMNPEHIDNIIPTLEISKYSYIFRFDEGGTMFHPLHIEDPSVLIVFKGALNVKFHDDVTPQLELNEGNGVILNRGDNVQMRNVHREQTYALLMEIGNDAEENIEDVNEEEQVLNEQLQDNEEEQVLIEQPQENGEGDEQQQEESDNDGQDEEHHQVDDGDSDSEEEEDQGGAEEEQNNENEGEEDMDQDDQDQCVINLKRRHNDTEEEDGCDDQPNAKKKNGGQKSSYCTVV